MLEEWEATPINRSILFKQGQIKSDIVMSYIFALKSYNIDRLLSLNSFDEIQIPLIITSGTRLFLSKKRNRFLITKNIFKKITEDKPLSITDLNVDTAFKVAWTGFMRIRELTYIAKEAKKAMFTETGLTKLDISFAEGDQYVILQFK